MTGPTREDYERRVYRLATLLTGSPVGAARVIEQVVGDDVDLRSLDDAHLDRLTVLRSREIAERAETAELVGDELPREAAAALAALSGQPREAWIFRHVCDLDLRETACAMDCSVEATRRHIEMAEGAAGMDTAVAAGALREHALSLEVPTFHRERSRRRRRWRLVRRIAFGMVLVGVIGAILVFGAVVLRFAQGRSG